MAGVLYRQANAAPGDSPKPAPEMLVIMVKYAIFSILLPLIILVSPSFAQGQDSAKATASQPPLFGRDIAPVLVANCLECHDDARKRGGLSMATPEKLTAGGDTGAVIQAGKADESLLVRHIRGDEQPRMPNGRRPLSDATIENIARWVAAGAKLDDGQQASAALVSLAWSPERIARDRLGRLSAADRLTAEKDELARAFAGVRPTQAAADLKTIQTNEHFALIGLADAKLGLGLLTDLDKARSELVELLKAPASHPLQSQGRLLVFVFQKPAEFAEFQRQNGFESTDTTTAAIGRLGGAWPTLAIAVSPEALDTTTAPPTATPAKKSRAKPARKTTATTSATSARSASALAVQALALAALETAPKAPAWLKTGMALAKAREYDRDDSYYAQLKQQARELGPLKPSGDWAERSKLFLKDQLPPQVSLPLAYSLVDWLKTTQAKRFPDFFNDLAQGGDAALDPALAKFWNIDRPAFLANWTSAILRSGSATTKKGR